MNPALAVGQQGISFNPGCIGGGFVQSEAERFASQNAGLKCID